MKIGILTYHSIYNFGANLQAFSTLKYLQNNGFEAVVIDYVPVELEKGYEKGNPPEQGQAHKDFIQNHFALTTKCRNSEDVASVIENENIDAVLIGSDAVLQHKNLLSRLYLTKRGIKIKPRRTNVEFPNPFWGSFRDFLKKQIPVSVLSASSQNLNFKLIKGKTKQQIGKALNDMSLVTVRDEWTYQMVQYFTKGKVVPEVTPDPVFAFNQNVPAQPTKAEILQRFNLPDKYVLFSFKHHQKVSEDWLQLCKNILEEQNILPVYLTMPGGVIFKQLTMKTIAPPLNPMDWYTLIKYSSGYVGENMHPIIVALHNAVPFYSFDTYGITKFKYFVNEKSSKIYHILDKAGLSGNRISTLGKKYVTPSPQLVMDKLLNFDQDKCMAFSKKQQEKYNLMMQKLIDSFQKI